MRAQPVDRCSGASPGRPRRLASLLIVCGLAAATALAAGCAGRTQTGAPSPASRPRSEATLAILNPSPGETVPAGMLHVKLALTGAVIVPQTSTHLSGDRGHIHLILDGKVVSMAYGLEQEVAATPGPHLLQAEFVATDHFPFSPRIIREVTFTAR